MSLRYSLSPLFLNAVCACGAEVSCTHVRFDGEKITGRAEHSCNPNTFREWDEEVNVFGGTVDYFAREVGRGRRGWAI